MRPEAPHPDRSLRFHGLILLISALLLLGAASALAAQSAAEGPDEDVISGRVLQDGREVAGIDVTLHRVTRDSAGSVATRTTAADGGFSFRPPPSDSTGFTVLFATAEYQGVRYFGPPIHPGDSPEGYAVEVFDTVFVSAPSDRVRLMSRAMILLPGTDGGWEVDEIVRIENPEEVTFISPPGMPTWELRIPDGVTAFQVGEGQFSADEVRRMGNRVLVTAPLTPGAREMLIRYRLPGDEAGFAVPIARATGSLDLFIRQPSPAVNVSGLAPADTITEQGERFLRFTGTELRPGAEVKVGWQGGGSPPVDPVHASVVLILLLLGSGAWFAVRGGGAPAAPRSR